MSNLSGKIFCLTVQYDDVVSFINNNLFKAELETSILFKVVVHHFTFIYMNTSKEIFNNVEIVLEVKF